MLSSIRSGHMAAENIKHELLHRQMATQAAHVTNMMEDFIKSSLPIHPSLGS
ncbi:hypothetical protein AB1K32_28135 [Metabacillus dongyingensis]|uniref:hypothetical protein n=1 Tax=Metabacillus dongyingensis TaxID=2874282 RepID=UPI003B8C0121